MYDPNDLNNKEPSYLSFSAFETMGIVTFILIVLIGVIVGAVVGKLLAGFLTSLGVSLVVYGIVFMGTRR